jgi:transposase InsO family protein
MPWREVSIVSLRHEFVLLATHEGANVRALCRRMGIAPNTAYKWLRRYRAEGTCGLQDRSRRPRTCPTQTSPSVEQAVLAVRDAHPAWGARKIRARLQAMGWTHLPAPSTLTAILKRRGRLDPREASAHRPWQRFEHAEANSLWQMDFKGHFAMVQGRCHPLTVLDDYSRFALGLYACANERGDLVQSRLTTIFRRYGLPHTMLMDNGAPWGSDAEHRYTPVTVWLLRLGIGVKHARPYHPQTQGKDERFHRTLVAEVLRFQLFDNLVHCQTRFDQWRDVYNLQRPHQALAMAVPASRYHASPRAFPEALPSIEYGPDDIVRKVQAEGLISYQNRCIRLSKAFRGLPVALRPTSEDGILDVFFCHQKVAHIDLHQPNEYH